MVVTGTHVTRIVSLFYWSSRCRVDFNYNCPIHTQHQTYLGHFLGPPILNNGAVSDSLGQRCQFAWELPLITSNGTFQPRISDLEVK